MKWHLANGQDLVQQATKHVHVAGWGDLACRHDAIGKATHKHLLIMESRLLRSDE
jgi:hypothetical protein